MHRRAADRAAKLELEVDRLKGENRLLQARLFGLLPLKLLTYDNYLSLTVDNVSAQPFPEVFGRSPSPLEPVARRYLGGSTPRARYGDYRHRAGR